MTAKWKAAKATCAWRSEASANMSLFTKTCVQRSQSRDALYAYTPESHTMPTVATVLITILAQQRRLRPPGGRRIETFGRGSCFSSSYSSSRNGLASSTANSLDSLLSAPIVCCREGDSRTSIPIKQLGSISHFCLIAATRGGASAFQAQKCTSSSLALDRDINDFVICSTGDEHVFACIFECTMAADGAGWNNGGICVDLQCTSAR